MFFIFTRKPGTMIFITRLNIMHAIVHRLLPVLILLLYTAQVRVLAQDSISPYSIEDTLAIDVDIFAEEELASITLIYDIKSFLRNKHKDEYIKTRMIYHFNDTIDIEHEIRLKVRGRNRLERCPFPPIWINISKADINNRQLRGIKKIKMVTHCARSKANFNYVFKEYLVYKMYNLLTPYSFRVRLIKVKYVDTGRKKREYDAWGFLIEPEDLLADRLDAYPLKLDNISLDQTDPGVTDMMAVYQYMIGNADYSIAGRHNVKLLLLKDIEKRNPIPVPYDFDYAGFVNANYAIPGDNLGITSVTQRYYLGPCMSEEAFNQIFSYFNEKSEGIYNLVESFEYLPEREKNWAIEYLDAFFQNAGNSRYIKNNILSTCR
jgi:hypothetical protein